MDPTWTSILPAFVAIALAFATRRVVPALFAAVVTGGIVLYSQTGQAAVSYTHLTLPTKG